ncbi:hypothetical protein RF11_12247 [Thelohanellus kitauei]|uniref:ISXO2-like transposase domain-containing protein n=1 Tax=Thelohanellus kitauei TaxID=669202 RepID=A0A0C2LZX2_THEKT|nr:hypothetical protein RF11_12247 [Thelohanellus kitauei]
MLEGACVYDLFSVPNRKAETLLPILEQYVLPEITIFSDCWWVYYGITNLESGYTHFTVNHRLNFINQADRYGRTIKLKICGGGSKENSARIPKIAREDHSEFQSSFINEFTTKTDFQPYFMF